MSSTDTQTQIGPGTVVRLHYSLYDEDGDLVDESPPDEPLSYVHGYGQIVPGLESQIEGMVAGQARRVVVEADDAYGQHDPDGILELPRGELPNPDAVKVNDELVAEGPDGDMLELRVIDVHDDTIVVDANHPLAGQRLRFEVRVDAVRAATDAELAEAEAALAEHEHGDGCGHDHGGDGHDHGSEFIAADRLLGAKKRDPGVS